MKILLIGNFAPPFEEENLQNITLFERLMKDGHDCSVINISEHPSSDQRFINPKGNIGYLLTLVRLGWKKDIIHFSTKGYLRVGLLKMMLSIFVAKVVRARSIITIYPEFFSILGQMRSPFGGTQTLNTSFYLADRLIFADSDTYDVATMYQKRQNFELVPAFISLADNLNNSLSEKLKGKKKVIVFTHVMQDSFLFEILKEMLTGRSLDDGTGIVIFMSGTDALNLKEQIEEAAQKINDNLLFIEQDDIASALTAVSHADIILRPLSCDGEVFFEKFTVSARKILHEGSTVSFPKGLVFIKEGAAVDMCAGMLNTMLSSETAALSEITSHDPYKKIITFYK